MSEEKYIPEDLEACCLQLDKLLADSDRQKIRSKDLNEFVLEAHFGLGMWIRNNWGLWKDNKLTEHLKSLGIDHPDSMSNEILTHYHKHLKG